MRRHVLSATAPACLLLGLTPLHAGAAVARPSAATATAARVSDLVSVSSTAASADDAKSGASAAVLTVGGKPVPNTGGSQSDEGENGGALLDTGSDKAPRVKVAPWKASAKASQNSARRSSRASAALAEIEVPDTLKAGVLTSDAAAEHSAERSTGTSTSNAADVSAGDTFRLVLLHSEVDSNAKGHSYLVGLGGAEIGTEEQLGELCALDARVAALSCLTASGGVANGITTGAAEVAGVKTALGLNPVSAFSTSATTAAGSIEPPPTILQSVAGAVPVAEAPRAAPATPSAELPRTGVAGASLAASGLTGLAGGLALRRLGRRRKTA